MDTAKYKNVELRVKNGMVEERHANFWGQVEYLQKDTSLKEMARRIFLERTKKAEKIFLGEFGEISPKVPLQFRLDIGENPHWGKPLSVSPVAGYKWRVYSVNDPAHLAGRIGRQLCADEKGWIKITFHCDGVDPPRVTETYIYKKVVVAFWYTAGTPYFESGACHRVTNLETVQEWINLNKI